MSIVESLPTYGIHYYEVKVIIKIIYLLFARAYLVSKFLVYLCL